MEMECERSAGKLKGLSYPDLSSPFLHTVVTYNHHVRPEAHPGTQ